jgi:hypothetical protein
MLKLATEWGKVEKALPKVERLPGENHRDRVLSLDEEKRYLDATVQIGENIEATYRTALQGIRALRRSEQPLEPDDPFLLRDVATILIDSESGRRRFLDCAGRMFGTNLCIFRSARP